MLDDLSVRDFFIPMADYPHIESTCSVCHAIVLMHSSLTESHKYRTILVTDNHQRLLGYLSLRDLIRAVGPSHLHKSQPQIKGHQPFQLPEQDFAALSVIWQEGFSERIREQARQPVGEVMTLIENSVSLDDTFAKCIHLLLAHDVLILPVIEGDKVLGVVRLVDMFELIANNLCQDASLDEGAV